MKTFVIVTFFLWLFLGDWLHELRIDEPNKFWGLIIFYVVIMAFLYLVSMIEDLRDELKKYKAKS